MKRQSRERKHYLKEKDSEGLCSSEWECSQACDQEEALVSDQKIEDLHRSLERLRDFVGEVPEERVRVVPLCVEEYYDKKQNYRVESREEVVRIAQRRLNKMLRNKKIKRNWNNEDISLLVWVVSQQLLVRKLSHFSQLREDWEYISSLIPGSTPQKCKFRWLSLRKVKLVTHKWAKQESNLLSDLVTDHSKINWKLVAQKLYERNQSNSKVFRTAKQCRQHWNCFLNPTIQKGPWTVQEDRKLLEYVLELEGSKKWSEISKFMQGRTENALKNRFNLLMNRQKRLSGNITEKRLVKVCLNRLMLEEGQQQYLGSPPSLHGDLVPESQESEEIERDQSLGSRPPIVPRVVESIPQIPQQLSYAPNINGFYNFLSPNMGMTSPNPFFFSFIIPDQF